MQQKKHLPTFAALTLALLGTIGTSHAADSSPNSAEMKPSPPLMLHVPSPDWRDQIIYFVMLDRFEDGNSRNNDRGAGEYDPTNNAKYSGGDLAGVSKQLDYIKGLGATAVWITPPVANQWWDGSRQYGGYHGYWAENFKAIDAHYGTFNDYRQLSHALHTNGMYLVQDIVVNHMGNFFEIQKNSQRRDMEKPRIPGKKSTSGIDNVIVPNLKSVPVTAPTQAPFSMNGANDPSHRAADIYHWTPEIADFTDHTQETTYQLAELDDLNTENPVVRSALRDSYSYWIREVGVDAFRVDTAFHVPAEFFEDFLYAKDAQNPGVIHTAEQTGRKQFHVFGEGFGVAPAYSDKQAKKVDSYMRAPDGTARLPGMINFPLYGSIVDVFARGRPTAELGYRIRSTMQIHQNPHLMPSFVDNHDVDRFLAGGSEAGLKQALLLIMTLPGIPTLYYGTEQGFREQRASMFASGYGANGRAHFDANAPLYQFIQRTTALRKSHPLFSRGTPTVLAENAATAGAFAYRMSHGKDSAFVIFNTANKLTLLDNIKTGLPAGTVLEELFDIGGSSKSDDNAQQIPKEIVVGKEGRLTLRLAPHAGLVWKVTPRTTQTENVSATLTLNALPKKAFHQDVSVSGTAKGVAHFKLIVDGDLANAQTITPNRDGSWQASLRTDSMIDPTHEHRVVAWSETPAATSPHQTFKVTLDWKLLTEVKDPTGDDKGPTGRYQYPIDPSWSGVHPLDIRNVRLSGSGGAIKIDVQLQDLLASWNPPNGFDHLALTLYLQIPDKPDGSNIMPLQNSKLPNGMRWHYRLRANGWSNALFTSENASATNEGTGASTSATLLANQDKKTVSFLLPASAIGNLPHLSGLKLYVTTWDYDSGYKPLEPTGRGNGFTGGDGDKEPLVMDDTAIIIVP